MANLLGTGPVAITTATGAHLTIPLSALTYDGSAITFTGWPPAGSPIDTAANKTAAKNWVGYLFGQGELIADTPGGTALPGPAFLVEATEPGFLGNGIAFTISDVGAPANPPAVTTMTLEVTVVNDYPGLTPATIANTIGTTAGGGSKPGLVHVVPGTIQMPDATPSPIAFVAIPGAPPQPLQASVPGSGGTAFVLEAPPDGGAGKFEATVTLPATPDGTFDLNITWHKKATDTLANLPGLFAYVVKITAPPGGFAVPAVDSSTHIATILFNGGTDPANVTSPAKPAGATVLSV
jgi:hypothetical protein